jgi:hypothetical protein
MLAVPSGIWRSVLAGAVAAGIVAAALCALRPAVRADEEGNAPTDSKPSATRGPSAMQSVSWIDGQLLEGSDVGRRARQEMAAQPFQDFASANGSDDPRTRLKRLHQLHASKESLPEALLLVLSFDRSAEVRSGVLQLVRKTTPDADWRARVEEMRSGDPSEIVRGYASLVQTDWEADSTGTPRKLRRDNTPSPAAKRTASRGDDSSEPGSAILRTTGERSLTAFDASSPSDHEPVDERFLPGAGGTFVPSVLRPVSPYWGPKSDQADASRSSSSSSGTATDTEAEARDLTPSPLASDRAAQRQHTRNRPKRARPPFGFDPGPIQQMSASDDAFDDAAVVRIADRADMDDESSALDDDGTDLLNRPLEPEFPDDEPPAVLPVDMLITMPFEAPLGFTGPSSIRPTERQTSGHFVPAPDRWRNGFTPWDRYDKGHPINDDYPYVEGHWWDPYNQNVLKGDYPIYGQHTFLNITASEVMINEFRKLPTATTPFESTARPFQEEFFGKPNQYFFSNFMTVKFDLFHGNTAFKPADWRIRITPVFNNNFLQAQELAVVNPDVRKGKKRARDDFALQEYFIERKLADLSPDYDFVSLRIGSQPFVSDFRGFIFADTNRAVRLFGTLNANRDQFNLAAFDQAEKETNSGLNTSGDRHQQVFIANYYRQDFLFPGYTQQASVHYSHDQPSFKFDRNDFLVRPDPAGVALPHEVNVMYLGLAGDGHMGRYNISHAFYWAMGQDSLNPIAGREQDIDAKMAAVELSYDRDWVRFRASYFYASGDTDVNDKYARGFDTIFDNANFAGGQFSFWQRQNIPLFGVNLVNRGSIVPDLRSSKIQGQSNFVNPGLQLVNFGMDFDVTPKLKVIANANHLWFDSTRVLEQFTFQNNIRSEIGFDLSVGTEYRPFLNDNVVLTGGFAALIPGRGFDDIYGIGDPLRPFGDQKIESPTLYSAFLEMALVF